MTSSHPSRHSALSWLVTRASPDIMRAVGRLGPRARVGVLPRLLTAKRRHVEVAPGGPHRLVAAGAELPGRHGGTCPNS
jgi:hypothetical protein